MLTSLRICPGRYLADASIWIAMAYILSMFTITPVIGGDGEPEVILPGQFDTGITRYIPCFLS